jgi:predicted ATPase
LIRDIAYESLLHHTRQGYHQRAATVLGARFPETAAIQSELLAQHYTQAGLNVRAVGNASVSRHLHESREINQWIYNGFHSHWNDELFALRYYREHLVDASML